MEWSQLYDTQAKASIKTATGFGGGRTMMQRTASLWSCSVGCGKGRFMPLDITGNQKDVQKPQ